MCERESGRNASIRNWGRSSCLSEPALTSDPCLSSGAACRRGAERPGIQSAPGRPGDGTLARGYRPAAEALVR